MAISEQSHLKKTSNSLSNDIILYPIAKTSNDKLLNTEETVSLIKETVIPWSNIEDKPTSLSGYGIINAYTKTEVDNRIASAVTGGTVDLTGYLTKDKADNAYLGKHDIANSANKLNTNAGSTIQPVYFENGIPVETAYTLETSVPSGAKFTDTVYTHPSTHAASMITGLADVAISGAYSDLTGTPSALPADGGDADTVSGFTVGTNVPANAKFTDTTYNASSASAAGLMSAEDKAKLDSIAEGANNYTYTLPNATSSTLGGVKVGTNISVSSGTISVANGSTSAKGVVQLTNSTSSTSTTTAATPSSVKAAYDLADSKQSPATTLAGYGITDAYTKTQVDSAIGIKANTADLATVATSGAYADLSGTPTSLKNPNSLTLQNSAGTSLGSYNGSEAKTIKLTASTVGLGNVTNESKATMFTSAALTGTPTAPTASASTNSTQIATTAFVTTAVANKTSVSGNAGTATKLATARTVALTGDATASGSFDGSEDLSLTTTLVNSGVTAGSYGQSTDASPAHKGTFSVPYITVDAKGRVTSASTKTITLPADNNTTYSAATTSAAGLMSASDKEKLDGIASGANNYTYTLPTATSSVLGGVKVGSNITNSSGTISLTKTNVTSALGYTPPTTNTTYSAMTGATSSAAGATGLVPAPAAGKQTSFLRGDGTWVVPTNTTYSAATTSAAGLMSASDKSKLDGIATGANAYTHPSYTARTGKPTANQTPAFGGTATVSQITSDALGHVTGATDRTIKIPSTLSNGTGTAGLIKTTSTVTSNSGYTPCPVISGVPYYKDTNTTYTLGSFGISATATELNYCDGVTSNIQTQLNNKLATSGTATKATADASGNVITDTYETKANAITGLSVSGKTVTYTKGDGTTGTITTQDTNTTYSKMSASEATTGTATTARSITAKVLHDKITEVVETNAYTHPSTHSASMITGLATVATSGKYSDLTGTPSSLPANGGNADTVSGFTVKTSVPADAKFTDTTYSNATTSKAGLMSAYDKIKLDNIKLDNIQTTNNSYSVYGNTVDRDSSLPTYGLL